MSEALAHNVKGHVALIGPYMGDMRAIGFVIRHGDQVRLKATDPEVVTRAERALRTGECLEILYEDKPEGPYDGILFHIC